MLCRTPNLNNSDLGKLIKYQFNLQWQSKISPHGVPKLKAKTERRIEGNSFLSLYHRIIVDRALARQSAYPQKERLEEEVNRDPDMLSEHSSGEENEGDTAAPDKEEDSTERIANMNVSDDEDVEDGGVALWSGLSGRMVVDWL